MAGRKAEPEFVVDTSVLVNIRDEHGNSVAVWKKVIAGIRQGRVKTVRQVWAELVRRFPDIAERLKSVKVQFVLPDTATYSRGVVSEMAYLNQHHRKLWNPRGGRNPADPFLIAVAKDQDLIVVTDEKRSGPGHQSRIPYVCTQRNVGNTDRLGFLKQL
jgi:hypothetical protein